MTSPPDAGRTLTALCRHYAAVAFSPRRWSPTQVPAVLGVSGSLERAPRCTGSRRAWPAQLSRMGSRRCCLATRQPRHAPPQTRAARKLRPAALGRDWSGRPTTAGLSRWRGEHALVVGTGPLPSSLNPVARTSARDPLAKVGPASHRAARSANGRIAGVPNRTDSRSPSPRSSTRSPSITAAPDGVVRIGPTAR